MTLVLRGGFIEDLGGHEHVCRPMSIVAKPAGAPHANRYASAGARSFIVECTLGSGVFAGFDRVGPQIGFAHLVPLLLELYRAFREMAPERAPLAEELALEIVDRAGQLPRGTDSLAPAWLPRIEQMIRAGCIRPIRLSTLGAEAGVHPGYLARVFRRHLGRSVGSYMLHCRVERAMSRLADSDEPLSRIALETGFTDQPCFTRVFGREVGMTPARFRRLVRIRFGSFKN